MTNTQLDTALAALQANRPLSYPTETFYAVGCLSLSKEAIDALSQLKKRSTHANPYPLLLGSREHLALISTGWSSLAEQLMDAFWPGPLTLVLPARDDLDPRIVGSNGGVAIRQSSHPTAQELSKLAGQPLISTSANLTGEAPPSTAAAVLSYFPEVDIFDGGETPGGSPSTIIDMTQETPKI